MYDFDAAGLVKDVILPGMEDARFYKPYKEFASNFTEDSINTGGKTWRHEIKTSSVSTARNFTKADVDPLAGTFDAAEAYWNFIYQEAAAEVYEIEINQAANGGIKAVESLLQNAIDDAFLDLWDLIYDDVYAQFKLDLLASGTYSDAALNRTTYPVLAPYNEVTNTTITVPLVRNCQYNTQLNKTSTGGNQAYRLIMEPAVLHAFRPQAALLNTWNENNDNNKEYSAGYAPVGDFEGSMVTSPQGMTTGDLFFVRKPDCQIKKHMDLGVKTVPSGRASIKVILRVGVNGRIINIGKQGMMTNKD